MRWLTAAILLMIPCTAGCGKKPVAKPDSGSTSTTTSQPFIPVPQLGHSGTVQASSLSPDGTMLATAGSDGAVKIWDAATHQLLHTFHEHLAQVNAVTWSPDGKLLASAGNDAVIRIWHPGSDASQTTIRPDYSEEFYDVGWNADGSALAWVINVSPHAKIVGVTRMGSGKHITSIKDTYLCCSAFAWHPDGRTLAIWGDHKTLITRPLEDVIVRQFPSRTLDFEGRLAWSPDAKSLIYTFPYGEVVIRRASSGEVLWSSGNPAKGESVAQWKSGKNFILSSFDGLTFVWKAANGEPVTAFYPAEKPTASMTTPPAQYAIDSVAWNPDGRLLAAGSADGTLRFWDTRSGLLVRTVAAHSNAIRNLTWSPDGKHVATSSIDQTIKVWNPAGTMKFQWDNPVYSGPDEDADVIPLSWSPDGTRIASGSGGSDTRIWNVDTGALIEHTTSDLSKSFLSMAWSPAGKTLARETANCLAFRPDGKTLLFALSNKVEEHAVNNGVIEEKSVWESQEPGAREVSWNPGGQTFAAANPDGIVRLWRNHALAAGLVGHHGQVRSVSWNPDRTTIASGGKDGSIRIWDAATGETRLVLMPLGGEEWIAWEPKSGRYVCSSRGEERMMIRGTGGIHALAPLSSRRDSLRIQSFP